MSPRKAEHPARQAIWEVESTHPTLVDQLDKSLAEVIDPEIGLNILELGLVRNVSVNSEEEKAHVVMIMTTPFCPYAPALLEAARMKVEETTGFTASIEMGTELWDPTYMEEGAGGDWGLF
jgi:metal-sulfur cluster biosynthetic enzyme